MSFVSVHTFCNGRGECGSFGGVCGDGMVVELMALWWGWRGCRDVGVVVEVAWLKSLSLKRCCLFEIKDRTE